MSAIVQEAHTYAGDFRRQVGQCVGVLEDVKRDRLERDLFSEGREHDAGGRD